MRISFHGAAREVTGSCHLVEVDGLRILLDCGMIQGGKDRHQRNRDPFAFDPESVDAVVLSHAHIDHSGRLPLLVQRGYEGPIYATPSTIALVEILLLDSAHIQEEDARWKIKRLEKRGEDASWVTPLYTEQDARAVFEQLVAVPFTRPIDLGEGATGRIIPAGHILGAGIVELELPDGDGTRRLTFSGDLGVQGSRLMGAPDAVACPDVLIMESTYGNRSRDHAEDRTEELYEIVSRTVSRGGKVVIPSFAVGRTQEVLARLNDLVEGGRLQRIPVFVDSPMAISATRVFSEHPEALSDEAIALIRGGDDPLKFPDLHFTRSVEDSKAINDVEGPAIIISASGMCTAGRIKHHLAGYISDPRTTVLFVGYQAAGTLGNLIQSGVSPIRIFGDWHDVNAEIAKVEGFSAHADREELHAWFESLGGEPERTIIVHGEEAASLAVADGLRDRHDIDVLVPERGTFVDLS